MFIYCLFSWTSYTFRKSILYLFILLNLKAERTLTFLILDDNILGIFGPMVKSFSIYVIYAEQFCATKITFN